MAAILVDIQHQGDRARLRTLRDLDAAALRLRRACAILLDPTHRDPAVREAVFAAVAPEDLAEAMQTVEALTRPPDDRYYAELVGRYSLVRQFLPTLLRTVAFGGTAVGQPLVEALAFLRRIEGQRVPDLADAPLAIVPRAWQPLVRGGSAWIDRRAYTLCVLEQLRLALRRREVFVAPSARWGDPRAKLLQGPAWEAARPQVCRLLGRATAPATELAALGAQLDEAYRRTAAHLPENTAVRFAADGAREALVLTPLDRLAEPPSASFLKYGVDQRTRRSYAISERR